MNREELLLENRAGIERLVRYWQRRKPYMDPEDVGSVVWETAWRATQTFSGDGSYMGYLVMMSGWRLTEYMRNNSDYSRHDFKMLIEQLEEGSPIPARRVSLDRAITDGGETFHAVIGAEDEHYEQWISREDAAEVACLMECLNLQEHLVITLIFWEDLPEAPIAELLGVSESRVSQIKGRALLKMAAKANGVRYRQVA